MRLASRNLLISTHRHARAAAAKVGRAVPCPPPNSIGAFAVRGIPVGADATSGSSACRLKICDWLVRSRSLGPWGLASAELRQSLSPLPKRLKSADYKSALLQPEPPRAQRSQGRAGSPLPAAELDRGRGYSEAHGRRSEAGVALVITLILLAVITFMAITFLVVSRAEHGNVQNTTDQTVANLAAGQALAEAQARAVASILATTNEFNYGLMVSTNYINTLGFLQTPRSVYTSPTNVNYNYTNGTPLTGADLEQNVANLWYAPRVPVFFPLLTNIGGKRIITNDFRFYRDENRNGRYDTNGTLAVISSDSANPYYTTNAAGALITTHNINLALSNTFVGDPEWIGGLDHPEQVHSANNRFIYRYAYIVVPVGQTLDINHIHNYVRHPDSGSPGMHLNRGDGLVRNEGVGTWEDNLAGALVDLNTNMWPGPEQALNPLRYRYREWMLNPAVNDGSAFIDALALLRYRYNSGYYQLLPQVPPVSGTVHAMFGSPGDFAFVNAGYDSYTLGGTMLMTGTLLPTNQYVANLMRTTPWSGADNPVRLLDLQDLFDPAKTSSFCTNLWRAGTSNDSYNRYTFYRMLPQLGTDSGPEPAGKMNLNYDNLVQSSVGLPHVVSATNFISWRPLDFFVNAANRLLASAGYTFTVTNIQIYPTNYYTPSVHRLLQVAANMYDATTNRGLALRSLNDYPSVFRPFFSFGPTPGGGERSIYIGGYTELAVQQDINKLILDSAAANLLDLSFPAQRANVRPNSWVAGIPLIVGAKKGQPNFNEFAMQTSIEVIRSLSFSRPSTTGAFTVTNQAYQITNISSAFSIAAWNSYSNAVNRNLDMYVWVDMRSRLTNEFGLDVPGIPNPNYLPTYGYFTPFFTNFTITRNTWFGFTSPSVPGVANSYILAFGTTNGFTLMTNVAYSQKLNQLVNWQGNFPVLGAGFHVPRWWLSQEIRVRLLLYDPDPAVHRIVDYVNLATWKPPVDINSELMSGVPFATPNYTNSYKLDVQNAGALWLTNHFNPATGNPNALDTSITYGIQNQISTALAALGKNRLTDLHQYEVDECKTEFQQGPIYGSPGTTATTNYVLWLPADRTIYVGTFWQANDPLVHYTIGDLQGLTDQQNYVFNGQGVMLAPAQANWDAAHTNVFLNLLFEAGSAIQHGQDNCYQPWTNNLLGSVPGQTHRTLYNIMVQDPLITRSDDWPFLTNKYPSLGWLGRVHRGTPWQTVYLKSPGIDFATWTNWSGDTLFVTNFGQFSTNILPMLTNALGTLIPNSLAYNTVLTNAQGAAVSTNLVLADALLTLPRNDFMLLDQFTTALDDNATRGQLNINQTNPAAWSAVFSGVIGLTNTLGNFLEPYIVDPIGQANSYDPPTNWPPLLAIVNGINNTRTNYFNGEFQHLGDILSVPQLTVASPLLNTNSLATFSAGGISDAVCERLPQQILGLLKSDHTPRFVIYAFGQTLKPAQNSLVTSGQFLGLCTNYQVTAEAATRTVVRIDGAPLPFNGVAAQPHAVIENFTVLPPD